LDQADYSTAANQLKQALEIRSNLYGKAHPDTANT